MRGTPPGVPRWSAAGMRLSASSARCPPTSSGSCVPGPRCCGAPSPACASWNGMRVALPPARSPSTWNCLRRPRPEPAVAGGTAGASWPVWVDLGTGLVSPSGSGIREAWLSSSAQRDAARPSTTRASGRAVGHGQMAPGKGLQRSGWRARRQRWGKVGVVPGMEVAPAAAANGCTSPRSTPGEMYRVWSPGRFCWTLGTCIRRGTGAGPDGAGSSGFFS